MAQTVEFTSAVLYGDWQINTYVIKRCGICLMKEQDHQHEVNHVTKTTSIRNIELVGPNACQGDHDIDGEFTERLPIGS